MDFTELSLSKTKIDRAKLLKNIHKFKKEIGTDTSFMAVVKANAYSHGAINLAQFMENEKAIDYFGVAQLQEGLELRDGKIQSPILIFNPIPLSEIDLAIENKITITVFTTELALAIVDRAEKLNKQALVHLKIDSGMGRIGVRTFESAFQIYQTLDSDFVKIEGIYTHFADAPHRDTDNFTHKQFNHFKKIIDQFKEKDIDFELTHACNTAATINFPEYHLDMVRVGIGLYGFDPTASSKNKLELSPIQNVQAKVTYIKDFPAGQSIGYGRSYFSKEKMKVATIGIGYADGVAKSLSNKAYFRYKGQKLPIIGQICMDQIMLDCSNTPDLAVGDYLSYFGDPAEDYSSAADLAEIIDSSTYELLCRIGDRVQKIYL